ncbi:MAG: hypothetical protein LC115_13615, partial [Bacteroidia bacterium]|nr:hypothetical protein [Bacteroidia bacterium]
MIQVAKIDFIFICISFCKIKSNQFPFSRPAVRWQKMALLVFWVGSCVGKNQMCHLWVGCLFTLTDNGLRIGDGGAFE